MHRHDTINYVKFPAANLAATKAFFAAVFGWSFVDYGPDYTAFSDQGLDGGFYRSDLVASVETGSALVVFYSDRLEETQSKIETAGGRILNPFLRFPAGDVFSSPSPAATSSGCGPRSEPSSAPLPASCGFLSAAKSLLSPRLIWSTLG